MRYGTAAALILSTAMAAGCGGYASNYRADFCPQTGRCTSVRFKYQGKFYQAHRRDGDVVVEVARGTTFDFEWELVKRKPLEGVVEDVFMMEKADEGAKPLPAREILK